MAKKKASQLKTKPARRSKPKTRSRPKPAATRVSFAAIATDEVGAPAATTAPADTTYTCKGFSLELVRNYADPGLPEVYESFDLRVVAADGEQFELQPASIADQLALVQSLLRRIADAKTDVGWTFQGSQGVITG